ncbi:unnamed protein product, partial [Brenthis ino]
MKTAQAVSSEFGSSQNLEMHTESSSVVVILSGANRVSKEDMCRERSTSSEGAARGTSSVLPTAASPAVHARCRRRLYVCRVSLYTPAPFETRYIHFRYRPPLFTPHALPLTAVLSVPSRLNEIVLCQIAELV